MLDFPKVKKSNFTKVNSSETVFLTLKVKKVIIYLEIAFIEAPILWHFDPECYIHIETNASG